MKYAAFIRGVGPGNPNMSHEKFKWFFESLGFTKVGVIISSGNVIFESTEKDSAKLEKYIEENLPVKLNFSRAVIIRDHDYLKKLFASDPFDGAEDLPTARLNVTFLKKGGEIFSKIFPDSKSTTKVMAEIEKANGKDVTMRTWKTIGRILKRMEE